MSTQPSFFNSMPTGSIQKGEVEVVSPRQRLMGDVRYAVAGDPVTHSLSALLLGLVHARLLDLVGQ